MPEYKGIDVSKHNGAINWRKVANTGIKFAIIRASYGWDNPDQIDPQLDANVKGCEANGIPYGFYHYSYAETPEDARKEASFFMSAIEKYKPSMPVYFDFEEAFQLKYAPEKQLQIIEAFIKQVEEAGYYAGLYMSASSLQRLYNYAPDRVRKYTVWVAHVGVEKTSFTGNYGMWQYSWKGKIDGSSAETDMNIAYVDFPSVIKENGLNGWIPGEINAGASAEPEAGKVSREAYDALQTKYDALQAIVKKFIKEVGEV